MGWIPCNIKQWTCVFRNWSRNTRMCNNRINKKVFLWGNSQGNRKVKNSQYKINVKFKSINMDFLCDTNYTMSKSVIKDIENVEFDSFKQEWYCKLMSNDKSKLRTYRQFKNIYGTETYITRNIPGKFLNFGVVLHQLRLKPEGMIIYV